MDIELEPKRRIIMTSPTDGPALDDAITIALDAGIGLQHDESIPESRRLYRGDFLPGIYAHIAANGLLRYKLPPGKSEMAIIGFLIAQNLSTGELSENKVLTSPNIARGFLQAAGIRVDEEPEPEKEYMSRLREAAKSKVPKLQPANSRDTRLA